MTLDDANGHTGNEQSTPATATTAAPAPRMTWDSTAPELDAFGNETVPVFTAIITDPLMVTVRCWGRDTGVVSIPAPTV